MNYNSLMKADCYLFFETLGSGLKIDIINKLKDNRLNVNELSTQLDQERSKVSHALKSLLDCNFVKVRKEGKNRFYSLNTDTILPIMDLVEKHIKKYCKICNKIKNGK